MVSGELARLTPADLGTFGQVVLSAFRRQAVTSPLLRLPADDLCYAFNLVRIPDDRRRRRGRPARDGQPGHLRAGARRRRHAVPGQRLPDVA